MTVAESDPAHRRSILFLTTVLALGGLVSSFSLPVALFPQVNFPRIEVGLEAGDRPAERMAIEVTYPVEEAIRTVPGVRNLRSATSRGSTDISVNFDWGQDMVEAMLQVQSAINQVSATLPAGTSFTVRRMDPTVFPVLAYSLTSDTHSLVELRGYCLVSTAAAALHGPWGCPGRGAGRRSGGVSGRGQSGSVGQFITFPGPGGPGHLRCQCHYRGGSAGRELQALPGGVGHEFPQSK